MLSITIGMPGMRSGWEVVIACLRKHFEPLIFDITSHSRRIEDPSQLPHRFLCHDPSTSPKACDLFLRLGPSSPSAFQWWQTLTWRSVGGGGGGGIGQDLFGSWGVFDDVTT